jgi:hypothetical protein
MRDKIIQKIKDYVKSLDTPDNEVYQENSLLIMSCFSKAMEIVENNSVVESDLVVVDKEKLNQIDKWIEDCKLQAEVFSESGMTVSEMSSKAMSVAYTNVKNLLSPIKGKE